MLTTHYVQIRTCYILIPLRTTRSRSQIGKNQHPRISCVKPLRESDFSKVTYGYLLHTNITAPEQNTRNITPTHLLQKTAQRWSHLPLRNSRTSPNIHTYTCHTNPTAPEPMNTSDRKHNTHVSQHWRKSNVRAVLSWHYTSLVEGR
jgi:hypothetical protein